MGEPIQSFPHSTVAPQMPSDGPATPPANRAPVILASPQTVFSARERDRSLEKVIAEQGDLQERPAALAPAELPVPTVASEISFLYEEANSQPFERKGVFNFLVAGASGAGKSTFISNVFSHLDPNWKQAHRREISQKAERIKEIQVRFCCMRSPSCHTSARLTGVLSARRTSWIPSKQSWSRRRTTKTPPRPSG